MCLRTVDKRGIEAAKAAKGFGWKAVELNEDGTISSMWNFGEKLNRWMKAMPSRIWASDYSTYSAGFHIFDTRAGARAYGCRGDLIVRVKYRRPTVVGTHSTREGDFKCIVAREMLVERPVRRTKKGNKVSCV